MAGPLDNVPGYGAYVQRKQQNEQQGLGDLQKMGSLMQLAQTMQAQKQQQQDMQRNEAMMAEIAAIPPEQRNRETVLPIVLKHAKTSKDLLGALPDAPKAQPIGAGGLQLPNGTVVPPQGRAETPRPQPIGAGGLRMPDGTVVPPAARPGSERGTPPSGYRWKSDGSLEAIPGGPHVATGFSPDALELRARQYLSGDSKAFTNLGRGSQGRETIVAITNRAAAILREQGGSPQEIGRRIAEFRANANSLSKMTQSYDAITAFEQTAVRNGKILKDLADKVDSTGVPVIERWVRAGRKEVAGDPDVARFMAQMQVYRTEAARILTNPNLSGQLTDSARKEVEEFLKGSASAPQIRGVVDLLERDFANRKQTLEQQMRDIRTRLERNSSAGEPGPTPTPPPQPTQRPPLSAFSK